MEKDEFVKSQDAPEELAIEAWEEADGDHTEASRLLSPVQLTIKGSFLNPEENLNGLFFLTWDYETEEITTCRGVLVSDSIEGSPLEHEHSEFIRQLQELESSPQLLSGYTEELEQTLKNLWEENSEEFAELIEEPEIEELIERLESVLQDKLEFNTLELSLDTNLVRAIEKDEDEDEKDVTEKDEKVTVPSCDVQVTPVQGVAVERLQPGDMIYVELGEIPEEWSKLKPVLEDLRDESGLIPAQLNKKDHTEDGRLDLQVQFGKKVYGSLSCGRDVSLMVPDETREKYDPKQLSEFENLFDLRILLPAIGVGLLIIFVVIWIL